MNDYINPANAVTASRMLALPPFLYCVHHDIYQWASMLVIACGLLDKLDGLVARIFNCSSGFGELFDAITDAICYGFFLIVLASYGYVPWIPVIVIGVAGATNSSMRAIYVRRAGRATNYHSFAMERLVGFAAFLAGTGCNKYEVKYFFYSCASLMVIVLIHDAKRMLIDPIPS
ncbi:MAG: CDP-alcohol phosphatidyltransferase family protein [Proteobacteria bacterium]|nr:CDP-alcohol phosphatidyltransferase family protein [Pseudomonadota bacterium]